MTPRAICVDARRDSSLRWTMSAAANDNASKAGKEVQAMSGDKTDGEGGNSSGGRERRQFQRVLVDLQVDYGHADNYLFAYIRDISSTGIFVRTTTPEKPGTRLNLRFAPEADKDELQVEGEVIWVNEHRPGKPDSLHPGMGVRFVDLSPEQRQRLDEFIKTFAYLDG
jgi:type IV pilus assembly protein PilZ